MASEESNEIVDLSLAKKKKLEAEELNVSDLELDKADVANVHGVITQLLPIRKSTKRANVKWQCNRRYQDGQVFIF